MAVNKISGFSTYNTNKLCGSTNVTSARIGSHLIAQPISYVSSFARSCGPSFQLTRNLNYHSESGEVPLFDPQAMNPADYLPHPRHKPVFSPMPLAMHPAMRPKYAR